MAKEECSKQAVIKKSRWRAGLNFFVFRLAFWFFKDLRRTKVQGWFFTNVGSHSWFFWKLDKVFLFGYWIITKANLYRQSLANTSWRFFTCSKKTELFRLQLFPFPIAGIAVVYDIGAGLVGWILYLQLHACSENIGIYHPVQGNDAWFVNLWAHQIKISDKITALCKAWL